MRFVREAMQCCSSVNFLQLNLRKYSVEEKTARKRRMTMRKLHGRKSWLMKQKVSYVVKTLLASTLMVDSDRTLQCAGWWGLEVEWKMKPPDMTKPDSYNSYDTPERQGVLWATFDPTPRTTTDFTITPNGQTGKMTKLSHLLKSRNHLNIRRNYLSHSLVMELT